VCCVVTQITTEQQEMRGRYIKEEIRGRYMKEEMGRGVHV